MGNKVFDKTITRALAEIKLLDSKIDKGSDNSFISLKTKAQKHIGGVSCEDITASLTSNYQSVVGLIKRRNELKSAVVLSNATNKVTINNVIMTVAEAIDRKNTIQLEQTLLHFMKNQYAKAIRDIEKTNVRVLSDAEDRAKVSFDLKQKSDIAGYEKAVKSYCDSNEKELIDPNSLKKEIDALEENILGFISEVDFSLSENNATVKI